MYVCTRFEYVLKKICLILNSDVWLWLLAESQRKNSRLNYNVLISILIVESKWNLFHLVVDNQNFVWIHIE